MLAGSNGYQVVIAGGKEGFPPGHHEWRDFLQLVVIRFMCQVHATSQKGEAAGGVKGGSGPSLHEWPGDRVHFMKVWIRQPSLRGKRVCRQRRGE